MGTYQSHALNDMGEAGRAGMVRTVRQVLTATTLPITAKLSDYVGRTFILCATALFWIIGPVIVATSHSLGAYMPGFLIYTLGHVCGNILNYALAVDTTTLRNRLFMQFVYIFPSIINVWSSGVIAAKFVNGVGWRWGAGMWSIAAPICTLGVIAVFAWGSFRARRLGLMRGIPSAWGLFTSPKRWVHLFWVMDIPGLFFLAAGLALILLPLSLGGGVAAKWRSAECIVPLVIGVLCLPVFALWELKWARHPIFPFKHMKDRHVMIILILSFVKSIAGSTRDSYLYFTLIVSFNQGVEGATRINTLEGFAGSVTLIFVAFIVRKYQIVKPLIIAGTILQITAQGMLVHFRGGYGKSQLAGLIAGEILEGIGNGLSSHPSLVAMQAKLGHEHALLVTSCWAVGSQAGGGIAAAISGAIWTQLMPGKLKAGLEAAGVPNAAKVAQQVFKSPLTFVKENPPFSVGREAIVPAYRDVQKILCIIGVVLMAVLLPLTFLIDNVSLDDRTTLAKDTESDTSDEPRHPNNKELDDRQELNNFPVDEKRDVPISKA
jgi:SIT family siderophore-iron:H+ symporter-like MFS transporter